jgi:hypothetical protein
VAKTRRSRTAPRAAKAAKKGVATAKAKPVRKSTPKVMKKAPKKAAAKPGKKVINLKELRKQFGAVLTLLAAKSSTSPETEARLDSTRRRVSQWMTDIDDICTPEDHEICGPDMAFPIP